MNISEKLVPTFMTVNKKEDGYMYRSKSKGLVVIQSINKELDGKWWIHTSYSRAKRMPTYEDTKFIKDSFIGENEEAIMVFPKAEKHINIHKFCLHLWNVAEGGNPIPDFTQGGNTI